ncbi:MAG: hypothetical protein M3464_17270 [Chloroflexota bacterium]|nr:hypothetical protein [Chloroflexota bacterium]
MSDPDKMIAPPGRRPEEYAGVADEAPLPPPPPPEEVRSTRREPIGPDDPLVTEPLGAPVANDAVSAGIPGDGATESPHDPAHTGTRPPQPGSAADAPEVPTMPDDVPEAPG